LTSAEGNGGGVLRHILRLSVPLALSQVGFGVMSVVDTAFIGRRSAEELAGVSLGNAVFFFLSVAMMGFVLGVVPLVAQAVGAGEPARARRALERGLLLGAVATVPGCLLLVGAVALLPYSGVDASALPPTRDYVLARMPGLPAMLFFIVLRGYLQGHDVTRPVVIAVVVANVLNVPADVLWIFGDEGLAKLGLPALGLSAHGTAGAGWATSLVTWVQALVLWPATRGLRQDDEPPLAERLRAALDASALLRVVRIGMPIGLQFAFEVAFFSSVSFLMGRMSAVALAGHQLAITIASVPFQCCLGIGSATAVVVGRRVGARDGAGALRAGLSGVGVGVVFQAVIGLSFLLAPQAYARAFTDELEVVAGAAPLIRIAGAFALSDGVQAIASGALRGAGDTAWPFVIHVIAHWAFGMPMALLFAFTLELGAEGLWWGLTTGLTLSAIALVARFVVRARRGYAALDAE
jgi:MATE family multidrug resistance protein